MSKRSILIIWFILLTGMTLLLSSCGDDETGPDPKFHYINMDCVIVEKLPNVPMGRDGSKAFLLRGVKDTTLYTEYTDIDSYYMADSVYYNHDVGDTLHFDYILKHRFFKK